MTEPRRLRKSRAQAFFEIARADAPEDDTPGGKAPPPPASDDDRSPHGGPAADERTRPNALEAGVVEQGDGADRSADRSESRAEPDGKPPSVAFGHLPAPTPPDERTARTEALRPDDAEREPTPTPRVTVGPSPGPITESIATTEIPSSDLMQVQGLADPAPADTPPEAASPPTPTGAQTPPPQDEGEETIATDAAVDHLETRVEQLRLLWESDREDPEVAVRLAVLLIERQEHDEAISLLQAALELRPGDPVIERKLLDLGVQPSPPSPAMCRRLAVGPSMIALLIAAITGAGAALATGPARPVVVAAGALAFLFLHGRMLLCGSAESVSSIGALGKTIAAAVAAFVLPAVLLAFVLSAWPTSAERAQHDAVGNQAIEGYARWLAAHEGLSPAEARKAALEALDLENVGRTAQRSASLQLQLAALLAAIAALYGALYHPLALAAVRLDGEARAAFRHVENWFLVRHAPRPFFLLLAATVLVSTAALALTGWLALGRTAPSRSSAFLAAVAGLAALLWAGSLLTANAAARWLAEGPADAAESSLRQRASS